MTTAGWYKDAKDPALARYHDGRGWTDHTMVMADWKGPGTPPPPVAAEPAWSPTAAPQSRQDARVDAAAAKARAKAMRPWYRKKRFIIPGILVVIIAISAIASAGGSKKDNVTSLNSTTNASTDATQPANTNKISADEFAAIQSGMTLAQVEQIIGGPGELLSDVNVAGQHDQVYMWDGSNASGVGANANVTFANDKVVSKAQFGLK